MAELNKVQKEQARQAYLRTPRGRQEQAYKRYNANPANSGIGAPLRSLFAGEGPEAAGTQITVPSYDGGMGAGGRYNTIMGLQESGLPPEMLKGIMDRTIGSDDLNVMVEGLVQDDPGIFNSGGSLVSGSGIQFSPAGSDSEILKGLALEKRKLDDLNDAREAEVFDFPSGPQGASLDKKAMLEKQSEELAKRELLGEEATFQPSPLDEIGALIAEAQIKTSKTDVKKEVEDLVPTFSGSGRGEINEKPGDRKAYEQQKVEEAFMAGMDDFILAARGENPKGPEKKTIEDYKKEFSKATGIDVSGKVDKSQALMSFGLALMQNKAGKGFNVGKMLSSVGEAGKAAMPELAVARKEAKQASLSAGKFALQMQSSDETKRKAATEKAMNRTKYYVMPKGEGIGGFVQNMDKAKSQRLNVFELNALTSNPEFDENFEVISSDNYTKLAEKAMETPEAAEYYSSTKTKQVLFDGENVDPMFTLSVFDVNPNVKNGPAYGKISGGSKAHEPVYRSLSSALKAINAQEEKLAGAIALAEGTAATTPEQLVSWFKTVGNKLGVPNVEGNTPTEQLNFYLKSLKVENAAEILGEAGKTLSDADRQLVAELIGDLKLLAGDPPDVIAAKLREFQTKIIVKKRNDILGAFRNLDGYARQDTSDLWGDSNWSEEDEAELLRRRKKMKEK